MIKCSRAGCSAEATSLLVWRNPKVHTDGRTKTWQACPEHLQFLTDYLANRDFLLEVKPL